MLQSISEKCVERDMPSVLVTSCLFSAAWKHFRKIVDLACEQNLVEPAGFEPATSSMPSRSAPNCATAPQETQSVKPRANRGFAIALDWARKKDAGSRHDTN